MPTLTKARTAQLCTDIRALAIKAAACSDGAHSHYATMLRELGLEQLLIGLAMDMAGSREAGLQAMLKRSVTAQAITEALSHQPTPEEIAAHRQASHAKQLAYLKTCITPQVPA